MKNLTLIILCWFFALENKAQFIICGQYTTNDFHHQYIPDTLIHSAGPGNFPIDINNDGLNDFNFTLYPGTGALGAGSYYCLLKGYNDNKIAQGALDNCGNTVAHNFNVSDTIKNNVAWGDSAYLQEAYWTMGPGCGGQFAPNTADSGYIGLKVTIGIDTLFGWIKIVEVFCSAPPPPYYDLTIRSFACEKAPVGLRNESSVNQLIIYPNPAADKIHIEQFSSNEKIDEIILINSYGTEYKLHLNDKNEIDLSKLAEGIYFLTIHANAGATTKKIVIQH